MPRVLTLGQALAANADPLPASMQFGAAAAAGLCSSQVNDSLSRESLRLLMAEIGLRDRETGPVLDDAIDFVLV